MNAAKWIERAARNLLGKSCARLVGVGAIAVGLVGGASAQQMYPQMPAQFQAAAPDYGYGYGAYGYGCTPAYGYAPAYSYVPGQWVQPAAFAQHHIGDAPCPYPVQSPTPMPAGEAAPEGVDDDNVPPPGEEGELPEVADLSSDAAQASASQSATPNMIGDTIGFGGSGYLIITDGFSGDAISISPGGGRKYKASTNNSPVPQCRLYYNFHYFDSALTAISDDEINDIDVRRHEVGFEYASCSGLSSLQVTVPFSWSIDSTIIAPGGVVPTPQDTELGNVSLALKRIVYQDYYTTLSLGLGVDLPTAEDVFVDNGLQIFELENETYTLSPFMGFLMEPTCNTFFQSFVQFSTPLGENSIEIGDTFGDDIADMKMLYIDTSLGVWLWDNGCGTAVAALGELHFSTTVGDEQIVFFDDAGVATVFFEDNWNTLHATGGLTLIHNCWSITPAFVLPLLDEPHRFFDWEATIQVNRRF